MLLETFEIRHKSRIVFLAFALSVLVLSLMACEVEPTSDVNSDGGDPIHNAAKATSKSATRESEKPATPEVTGFRAEATVAAE